LVKSFTMPQRKFVAIAAAFLLAAGRANSNAVALGVVSHAEHAHLGQVAASVGSTIYDGDDVSSDLGGTLVVTARNVAFELAPQSSVTIRRQSTHDGEMLAELTAGRLVFSAAQNASFAVMANDASIRPSGNAPAVAYVRIINKRELHISARRGAVEFSYRGKSEVVREGKNFKVVLDPSDQELAAASESGQGQNPAKPRRTFLLVAISLALVISLPLLIHALESPDRPGG
jgi:hypothetical protein